MIREEAIQILADLTDNFFLHTWEEQYKALHMAIEALSADAEQGEWHQISPARIYECSICNHNVLTDYIDTYNYCPNCGARMKGGNK